MAATLGALNPLRYRAYVYDQDSGLYYLQSRYYNPNWGRFINADGYASTGQDLYGNNMFAYCGNNPVMHIDDSGEWWNVVIGAVVGTVVNVATTAIKGRSLDEIVLSGICGAISGAFAATGFGGVIGQMAVGAITSAVDSGYQNWRDYKNPEKTMTLGEAIRGTLIDATLGAAFGAMGAGGTGALKNSNKIAKSYSQAKKVLKTKGLHPNVKATANAAVNAGKEYFWKTMKTDFTDGVITTVASTVMSKICEFYIPLE